MPIWARTAPGAMDLTMALDRCALMIPIKPSLALAAMFATGAVGAAPARQANHGPATHAFVGAGGLVRLRYADPLKPSRTFVGGSIIPAGWRLRWDAQPAGPGTEVVSVAQDALPTVDIGYVTEFVQVGLSRDPAVVATCGTAGLKDSIANRQPNRMLGGHRWTVWTAGDAGMSQEIGATNYRTVVNGVCYAIDRASYGLKAADPKPGLPTQRMAAARIDAVLASILVGGR